NDAPQVQLTCVSTYSGWMSRFKVSPRYGRAPGRHHGVRRREPEPTYQPARTGASTQNRGWPFFVPPGAGVFRAGATRALGGPYGALTTSLASPVAESSVAASGIARSSLRASQTRRALSFWTRTRLGLAGSYCTGMVTMCMSAGLMPFRPPAKDIREFTEPRPESVVTALVAVSARS